MSVFTLQDIVAGEFITQYIPDELPPEWTDSVLVEELPLMANRTALRLRGRVASDSIESLISLLELASQDPEHSLVQQICSESLMEWTEEPENWYVFRQLLKLVIEKLRADL